MSEKVLIKISKDLEQIFNKIDIAIRNKEIKLEYKYLHDIKGIPSAEVRRELADKQYITWNGRKYMLSEKTIQHIIYDLPIQDNEYYIEVEKEHEKNSTQSK